MNRIMIAAPHSGGGKTTVSMGLMAALVRRGLAVQPCKVGPDYIDTAYHSMICSRPALNLDGWLLGQEGSLAAIERCQGADIAVIEGVMGLYDGIGDSSEASTAEMARWLEAPVLLVVDAGGMAASASALVMGFQKYDPEINIAGVVFNNVGSDGHYDLLRRAVERDCGVRCYGYLPHDAAVSIESRHLGILPAGELNDARARVAALADLVERYVDVDGLLKLAAKVSALPPAIKPEIPRVSCRLAVAQDRAFNFYYADGLALLEAMGAELIYFSPLRDKALPHCDGVYIGGGFPEVFASELAANTAMRRSIAEASAAGMPVYGECGGFMYLTEAIVDGQGVEHAMCGALPGRAVMGKGLSSRFGYVTVTQMVGTPLGPAGLCYRAHEYHHSTIEGEQTVQTVIEASTGTQWSCGTIAGNTLGSYAHLHFAGEPGLAANFLSACRAFSAGSDRCLHR